MANQASASPANETPTAANNPSVMPTINRVAMEAPWDWLKAGWQDLRNNTALSLLYGLVFTGAFMALLFGLFEIEATALILVLASGFLIIGPIKAVGLYEASRLLEKGETPNLRAMVRVRVPSYLQMAYLGLLLMLIFIAWLRVASILYALFFGLEPFPPISEFVPELLFTPNGLGLMVIGSGVGAVMALVVFVVTAVSAPMLAHRDIDFMTAVISSINAVRLNLGPMMLWAWLIALFMFFGLLSLGLGVIVLYPLIGHATWHAYRDLVAPEEKASS